MPLKELDDEENGGLPVSGYGFADAKADLGIDQPSFADRITGPDIPRSDNIEDRRNDDMSTLSPARIALFASDSKQKIKDAVDKQASGWKSVADALGLTKSGGDEEMQKLKELMASFK